MKYQTLKIVAMLFTLLVTSSHVLAQNVSALTTLPNSCDDPANTGFISGCTSSLLNLDVDSLSTREQYVAWDQTATALESALRLDCQANGNSCFEYTLVQESNIKEKKKVEDVKEFANFRFGVGIAMTGMSSPRIDEVKIENGLVSVNKTTENSASLMLEAHQFLRVRPWGQTGKWGIGPFVSISITDEDGADPLSSYGAGLMFGWKQADSSTSWNVGIGAFVNTEVMTLRDGITDGMETTLTDTNSLTSTSDESGWMLMFSSTW